MSVSIGMNAYLFQFIVTHVYQDVPRDLKKYEFNLT